MTPHAYMKRMLQSLGLSVSRVARETKISRPTITRMLDGSTLGATMHRKALTEWGRRQGLVRADESWWEAVYRAAEEDAVARAVGRVVGGGLDRCPSCGASLDVRAEVAQ